MYVYNLTLTVSSHIHKQWLEWFQTEYVPKVKKSGKIQAIRIFKILNSPADPTYAIHHETSSPQNLLDFTTNDIPFLMELCAKSFGDQALMFGTELKEVLFNCD